MQLVSKQADIAEDFWGIVEEANITI